MNSSKLNVIQISEKNQVSGMKLTKVEVENKKEKQEEYQFNQTNYLALYDVYAGKNGEIKALINDDRGTITLEEKFIKSGETRLVPVKNTAVKVFPRKLMNGETTTYIQLEVKAGKKEKLVTCQLASLSNLGRRSDDLKQYVEAGGTMNKAFGEKLYDIVVSASNAGLIKEVQGYEKTGWNTEEHHVRAGDDLYIGNLPISVAQEGDFESWKNAVNTLLTTNGTVQASLPLAFAVGGYLMGLSGFTVNGCCPFYNMYSDDSSVGKSTLQKVIQSMQKEPNPLFSATSTRVGSEFSLASNNNGFLCIEELHGMTRNDRQPVGRLMELAEGGNRNKGTKSGGLAKALSWDSVIITSANLSLNSLAEGDEQKEALAARIIENNCVENPLFDGENIGTNIKNCMSELNKNYGVVYPEIIKFIKEHLEELRFMFAKYEKVAKESAEKLNGVVERKISDTALAYCGAVILEKLGVELHEDYDEALIKIVQEASTIHVKSDEEKERDIRDDMLTLFNGLLSVTRVDGYLAKSQSDCEDNKKMGETEFFLKKEEKQRVLAEEHNKNIRESYAVLDQKTCMTAALNATGYFWVSSSKGSKDYVLRKTGLSLDSIARRADLADMLFVQESARKQKRLASQKKGCGRGYIFFMSDFGDHLDGSDY